MCPQLSTSFKCSLRASFLAIALAGFSGSASAVQYGFLGISSNNVAGNTATCTFSSGVGNGTIGVTHSFSSGGAGLQDNDNPAIFPSQFTTVFPGTGTVQGHLAQTIYNNTSTITFDTSNYNITPSTVFGMWNTTDEVAPIPGPGGNIPVYRMQLVDNTSTQVNPTTLLVYGKQDNQTQVAGRHEMDMNPATGEISPGTLINAGGTHTSATFWYNIPTGTQKIIIEANLAPLNTIGDGVGYYFAEVVPEPASLSMLALGGVFLRRRR